MCRRPKGVSGLAGWDWLRSGGKLAVRGGGALALFILTFMYTPGLATDQGRAEGQINQKSEGRWAPA